MIHNILYYTHVHTAYIIKIKQETNKNEGIELKATSHFYFYFLFFAVSYSHFVFISDECLLALLYLYCLHDFMTFFAHRVYGCCCDALGSFFKNERQIKRVLSSFILFYCIFLFYFFFFCVCCRIIIHFLYFILILIRLQQQALRELFIVWYY